MWWAGKRGNGGSSGRAAGRGVAAVYVGQEEIRLAHGDEQQVVARAMPMGAALPLLLEVLKPLGRVRLRVLVSGGWCQPFVLPAVDGVSSDAEWLQVAGGLLQDLTGMPASSRLWLDRAQGVPPLAVALHPDVEALLKALAAHGRVQEVRPWWAAVLNHSTASADTHQGIAVIDSDAVTLLLADGDRYEVAQSYPLMGEPASSVLARALISHGRHAGDVMVKQLINVPSGVTSGTTSSAPVTRDAVPFLEAVA